MRTVFARSCGTSLVTNHGPPDVVEPLGEGANDARSLSARATALLKATDATAR